MNWLASLKSFRLRHFSKEKHERPLLKLVHKHRCTRIVELGVSDLERTLRMLQIAQTAQADAHIRYTGIDSFDARSDELPQLTLKDAHQRLTAHRGKTRLAPGTVEHILPRLANELADTDLLLVSHYAELAPESDVWYYVPRMLHADSLVLMEQHEENGTLFSEIGRDVVEARAEEAAHRRRRQRRAA